MTSVGRSNAVLADHMRELTLAAVWSATYWGFTRHYWRNVDNAQKLLLAKLEGRTAHGN